MVKQKIDIGDLVEVDPPAPGKRYQGVVVERKTINPNFDDPNRVYHPDEHHCRVLIINSGSDNDQRWFRTKWLKLLSKAQ